MERRRFLVLAAAALAGCGQTSDGEPPTSSPTESAPPSSTRTETPTPTPAETDTETPTESPTETQTPDPREERLAEAAGLLDAAVDAYVDGHGDASAITEVTADASVSERDVRAPLHDVRDHLSRLDDMDLTAEQERRLGQIRGAHWFLWWLVSAHNAVHATYKRVSAAWTAMQDRDWFGANNRIDDVPDRASTARDEMADVKSDSDASDMDGFDRLTPDDYDAKLDQFDDELADAESLGDLLAAMVNGFESYEAGGTDDYFDARRSFEEALDGLEDGEWAAPYEGIVEDAACVAEAMAAGCQYLDRAAQAEEDDEPERAEAYREDAQEEFASCEFLVEEFGIGE